MSLKEDIKNLLDNSYELSRAEIASKLGVTREQARKPLTKLLEAREIERRVEDGVEWFTTAVEEEQSVGGSQASYVENEVDAGLREMEMFRHESFSRGYKAGYEVAWEDIGEALALKFREILGVPNIKEQMED